MLASRLLKKTVERRGGEYDPSSCVIPLAIVIVVTAILVQLIGHLREPAPVAIFPEVSGLIQLSDTADIATYTQTAFTEPQKTFGAMRHLIGVYTQENSLLPVGTISFVYTRDNWRFVEIDFQPNTNLQEQRALLSNYSMSDVVLDDQTTGFMVSLWNYPTCIESEVDEFPGKCEITKVLYFPIGDQVVTIGIDGYHATEGEIIEMARSMLQKTNGEL